MSPKSIETDLAPSAIGPYSQAVQAGNLLFVSGQIPLDPETGEILSATIAQETERVMLNLQAILTAAGTGFDQVVKTTIFLKDLGDFQRVNEVYAKFFRPPYPARACVQVAKLPKDVRVEIDAIANVVQPEPDKNMPASHRN